VERIIEDAPLDAGFMADMDKALGDTIEDL
jgi:hypothetical protein